MTDYMNEEKYSKACRYRMQETIENLMAAWQVADEEITPDLLATSEHWLERMVEELRYFRQKLETASDGPPQPGFIPEKADLRSPDQRS